MRALRLRLAISLAALALVLLSLLDVAFLLWAQGRMNQERALLLRVAALAATVEIYAAVDDGSDDIAARLAGVAIDQDVVLTLIAVDGTRRATDEKGKELIDTELIDIPAEIVNAREPLFATSNGYEHFALPLQLLSDGVRTVIASQSLQRSVDRVLATQVLALPLLGVAVLLVVVLGLLFLRRTILQPMSRMTELVGTDDYDALRNFGDLSDDSFSQLGRAIISMGQKIREDHHRLARQLDQLRRAHDELEATQVQLVRSERLAVVGQLAAGLAHEIGNPLAIVSGFVELLRGQRGSGDDRDAERERVLLRIIKELDRIQVTVRALLDFSRAPEVATGIGDLGTALCHVEELLRPQQRMRRITLTIDKPVAPVDVAIATDALVQVLVNLVLNAADAIGGAGTIEIVYRVADDGSGGVVLCVDDSGPGVDEEIRTQIFDPFFTTKPAGAGTGLGLAVCERIVSAAGGALSVADSPLGGARFRLEV